MVLRALPVLPRAFLQEAPPHPPPRVLVPITRFPGQEAPSPALLDATTTTTTPRPRVVVSHVRRIVLQQLVLAQILPHVHVRILRSPGVEIV